MPSRTTSAGIPTSRIEAFSDGVIAILITIMVFDLKVPAFGRVLEGREVWSALIGLAPKLLAYLFSFVILGIMWANHHHTFHLIQKVDGKLLWLNLHFLFWLSLIPFPTSMVGANPRLPQSAALFGAVLTLMSLAYTLMRGYASRKRLMEHGERVADVIVRKVNRKVIRKSWIGTLAYAASVPLALWVHVGAAYACLLIQPVLFFIPDDIPEDGLDKEAPKLF